MLDFMSDKFCSSDSEEGVDIGLPMLLIALAAVLAGRVCVMGEGGVCLCCKCGFGCVGRHILD